MLQCKSPEKLPFASRQSPFAAVFGSAGASPFHNFAVKLCKGGVDEEAGISSRISGWSECRLDN